MKKYHKNYTKYRLMSMLKSVKNDIKNYKTKQMIMRRFVMHFT